MNDLPVSLFEELCGHISSGRHKEAREALRAGRAEADAAGLLKIGALESMLGVLEDREERLASLVAELSALRAAQEERAGRLEQENTGLRRDLIRQIRQTAGMTRSPAMQTVFRQIERVADVPVSLLITGETGTGKGLIAQYIHYSGSRARFPLVSLNCAAIPAPLLESELFGIEKGVASGVSARIGHFEASSGGTLFLDEIGDMPLESQAKILKVLESGGVVRVGGRRPISVDLRLITATHRDLEEACAQGSFRRDLFFRLNVIRLHLPPLRERRADIAPLAASFLESATLRYRLKPMRFAPEALRLLEEYPWPGNVRELEHEVERAALLTPSSVIGRPDLSARLRGLAEEKESEKAGATPLPQPAWISASAGLSRKLRKYPDLHVGIIRRLMNYTSKSVNPPEKALEEKIPEADERSAPPSQARLSLQNAERELIRQTLGDCGGNKSEAARRLGITREGLRKKLKRLGMVYPG
ncbi:MAG: sigma-54 dependent transcriptional regulator [Deltaproteobacteria bacterium]|jgi:DNA-binding NtrC family response regulator|nr:sigma-54 dependent transcriptional regulator [Deltaproteobacteria bacterium]